jgi:hypothetical protein
MPQAIGQLAIQWAMRRAFEDGGWFRMSGRIGTSAWRHRQRRRQQQAVETSYTGGIEMRRKLYGHFLCGGLHGHRVDVLTLGPNA